jgi:hypothetical protein
VPTPEWAHSLSNATFIVTKSSVVMEIHLTSPILLNHISGGKMCVFVLGRIYNIPMKICRQLDGNQASVSQLTIF